MIFSSTSFAEWTKVSTSISGVTFYVDFTRIKKHGGYVYYWRLKNLSEPDEWGDLSSLVYEKVDCELLKSKRLSLTYHTQLNAKGTPSTIDNQPDKDWNYANPGSSFETILKTVCSW